ASDEQPTIRGMTLRNDWVAQSGGVFTRTMEATPEPDGQGRSSSGPDYDPYLLMQDQGPVPFTPLSYAGDAVASPPDGQWSYDPATHVVRVNPIGTASPATSVYVPHFAFNVQVLPPTQYVTLQYLTFEGTRGRSIRIGISGSAMANGIVVQHVIQRYATRHFILAQNAPDLVIADNLTEVGCRGWSWA